MTQQPPDTPKFFLTIATPCPYLPEQSERKVFTHLVGNRAPALNDFLTQSGFRRSQNIAYRPACENCNACISIRILAQEFKFSSSMKRILKLNSDIVATVKAPEPTMEQYALFRSYLNSRHKGGGMSDMSGLDYAMMIEDTHVNTQIIEYRSRKHNNITNGRVEGQLLAVALTDQMSDGLSMVYSFYNPELESRSLGSYIILDHIKRVQKDNHPYIYLGYWVDGSPKMAYKSRFQPQEHLGPSGWKRYESNK